MKTAENKSDETSLNVTSLNETQNTTMSTTYCQAELNLNPVDFTQTTQAIEEEEEDDDDEADKEQDDEPNVKKFTIL